MPELQFKGKEFVYNHHLTVPYRPLIAKPDKSIGEDSGNMIINGDNLHALKALLPRYAGKVDCIFIDPPYNTGNEGWCYNDNVNSPFIKEWLNDNPINKEDMLRHDKWLSMMYPRFKLLRELLSEKGSLWMTLDYNEAHRARSVLDEIFGEENFIASISWEKVYSSRMDAQGFSEDFDYVLVYSKSDDVNLNPISFHQNIKQFTEKDEVSGKLVRLRSLRKEGKNSLRKDRPNMWYPIEVPGGNKVWPIKPDGTEGCWRWGEATFLKRKSEDPNSIAFVKDDTGNYQVCVKQFYEGLSKKPPSTLFKQTEFGHTHEAQEEIKRLFGDSRFPTPKPVKLIRKILELSTEKDSLVLDNFAGSGTTAHAVLEQNAKDGGNRNFILVECEDYTDKITAERVRRVINGYEFKGTQKEELLREKITYSTLKNADDLVKRVEAFNNLDSHRFDNISKSVKNGELVVTGENKITEKVEGLGGGFTYYTLGEPVDLDKLLTGENLPDYANIGAWLFHTATGDPLDPSGIDEANWYLGESKGYHIWLIYKPELDFLKSRDAALTLSLAEKISDKDKEKRHLVFAPARYVPNKTLLPLGVEHAPLPFALYRFEKD